jgi:hypothetical protein
MFWCAEDWQAVRSGDRHASLSRSDYPYSVVRLETGHSAVPICQHVSRRAQRWSRRAAGPRTTVRLVLDGSEHADTISQIERKPNAALTVNTVSRVLGRPQRRAYRAPVQTQQCSRRQRHRIQPRWLREHRCERRQPDLHRPGLPGLRNLRHDRFPLRQHTGNFATAYRISKSPHKQPTTSTLPTGLGNRQSPA